MVLLPTVPIRLPRFVSVAQPMDVWSQQRIQPRYVSLEPVHVLKMKPLALQAKSALEGSVSMRHVEKPQLHVQQMRCVIAMLANALTKIVLKALHALAILGAKFVTLQQKHQHVNVQLIKIHVLEIF